MILFVLFTQLSDSKQARNKFLYIEALFSNSSIQNFTYNFTSESDQKFSVHSFIIFRNRCEVPKQMKTGTASERPTFSFDCQISLTTLKRIQITKKKPWRK